MIEQETGFYYVLLCSDLVSQWTSVLLLSLCLGFQMMGIISMAKSSKVGVEKSIQNNQ